MKVLICGAGCAGPVLAYWLVKGGHEVVIVERFPNLRATGAQIDMRSQGIEVMKKMNLEEIFKSKVVDEAGVSFIDSKGISHGSIVANRSGEGRQSFTSEYEMMRGDIVRTLYDITKDDVKYVFGKSVDSFEQNDNNVVARFSDGSTDTFDLLVGADGQGSRIRSAIMPPNAPEPYRRLGVHIAYWIIPSIDGDDNFAKWYTCEGGRIILSRTTSSIGTQVYLKIRETSEEASSIHRASIADQKAFWMKRLEGSGWQEERFREGLKSAENFYSQELVQVRTDTWSKGRVVLLGDAAHCPAPLTGMGTTGSFVGAYVLAGEINRNPDNLSLALQNYEKTLRPFVNEIQTLNSSFIRFSMPKSQFGVNLLMSLIRVVTSLKIPELFEKTVEQEHGGWTLPDYSIPAKSVSSAGKIGNTLHQSIPGDQRGIHTWSRNFSSNVVLRGSNYGTVRPPPVPRVNTCTAGYSLTRHIFRVLRK